ncbi:hypothetical protein E2I00_008615, partial [Balaenoptera physalus]
AGGNTRLWLRGLVLQALRNAWGICASHGQLPPLSVPQKIVATWEVISLGRQPVPEYFNFAHDVLDVWSQLERAGHRPPIPAFWWVNGMGAEVKGSLEELGEQSRKAANVLGGHLTEKDLKFWLQTSRAKSIITSDSLAPPVDAISASGPSLQTKLLVEASTEHKCARTRSQDPPAIYFISGTTGAPRMVEHSQANYGLSFMALHGLTVSFRAILRRQQRQSEGTSTSQGTEPTWTRMATFGSWEGIMIFVGEGRTLGRVCFSLPATGLGPVKWRVHLLSAQPSWSLLWSASSLDPIRGEVVKAFIVLSPAYSSHDPEKLTQEPQEHVKRVTAPYKYPRKGKHLRMASVSELPKTVSGKIQRSKLRRQEWGDKRQPPKGPIDL